MPSSPLRHLLHRVLAWSGPTLLVLVSAYQVAVWISERLWFESLGYGAQFDRLFGWRAASFGAGALLFGAWLGFNAHLAWRNCARHSVPLSFFQSDDAARLIPLEDKLHLDRYRRRATFVTLAGLSWLAGLGFSARYALLLRAFSMKSTGLRDAASGFDLAFFLFALPFYLWLSRVLLIALVAALAICLAIYAYEEVIGPRAEFPPPTHRAATPRVSRAAAKHLAILWALLLLWRGGSCILSVPASFVSGGGAATRVFDPIDISWGWTSAGLFAFSAPLVALLSGLAIAREPRPRSFLAGAGWMTAASLLPTLLPLVIARDPRNPEWTGAISRHISNTRHAWGLDHVAHRSLTAAGNAPFRTANAGSDALGGEHDSSTNAAADANAAARTDKTASVADEAGRSAPEMSVPLPLWPASAAREAFNRRLEASGSPARVAQVWLERAGDALVYCGLALPPRLAGAAPWRARHERPEQGVWLRMDGARVGPGGAPLFRPDAPAPALFGAWPEIASAPRIRTTGATGLFGANSEVASDGDEWILAPGKGSDGEADFERSRGVPALGWGVKMLLSMRFLDLRLARASQEKDRVIWHRGAAERCRELAPFLDWPAAEARPILTVAGGFGGRAALQWIVPGVVWSNAYPDSAIPGSLGGPLGGSLDAAHDGANYGRHIAAGVVDARTGAVALYLLDPSEPFAALYNRLFPGLFEPPTAMPGEIRAELRPSPSLLGAQAAIWERYHDSDPLSWVAHRGDYRPLFGSARGDDGFRPLASSPSGDWDLMAYARPEGQADSGSAPPLVAILGADERPFALGTATQFTEWRASDPLPLPAILIEPLTSTSAGSGGSGSSGTSTPMIGAVAPLLAPDGAARGLIASAGTVIAPKSSDLARQIQLKVEVQSRGAAPQATFAAPKSSQLTPEVRLESARAAWREVQAGRKRGDWARAGRAEKQLEAALNAAIPLATAKGSPQSSRSTAKPAKPSATRKPIVTTTGTH